MFVTKREFVIRFGSEMLISEEHVPIVIASMSFVVVNIGIRL